MAEPILYELADGTKRYKIKVYLGVDPLTGKQIETTRRGFTSPREARKVMRRLQVEFEQGQKVKKKVVHKKFAEVYRDWFSSYKNTVCENTQRRVKGLYKNHMAPYFNDMRIDQIDRKICQKYADQLATKVVNYQKVLGYTQQVFKFALMLGAINDNPFQFVQKPRARTSSTDAKENFLDKRQAKAFYRATKVDYEDKLFKAFVLFRVLLFSGLRKGEALALRYQDINSENSTLSISKTLSRDLAGSTIVKEPKTKSGHRIVGIDQTTLDLLLALCKQRKLENEVMNGDDNFIIFSNTRNGYLTPSKPDKWLARIINRHQLKKITVHGLRHTYATLAIEAGINPKQLQYQLGHADIKTTLNIYTNVSKRSKEKTTKQFSKFMNF